MRQASRQEFSQVEFQQFWTFWSEARQGRLVPNKSCFRPEKVPHLIRFMALGCWEDENFFRFRVLPREIIDRLGITENRRNFLEQMKPVVREYFQGPLRDALNHPVGLLYSSRAKSRGGQVFGFRNLVLPLENPGQRDHLMLSCILPDEDAPVNYSQDHPEYAVLGVTTARFLDLGAGQPASDPRQETPCKASLSL